jgi:hypothetical protein
VTTGPNDIIVQDYDDYRDDVERAEQTYPDELDNE